MRIGELAERVGLNPKTIRYYESIGVLPEPERTPSGYRDYDATYASRLTFIRTAQRLGITLDEVKEFWRSGIAARRRAPTSGGCWMRSWPASINGLPSCRSYGGSW